jgi:23S rRNA (adenine2503-C2)-methyltransferase
MPTAASGEPAAPSRPISEPATARSAIDPRPGLSGLPAGELERWLVGQSQPSYRARQIRAAVWRAYAAATADMRTLPATLREALERDFRADTIAAEEVTVADGGLTEKSLHRLSDGAAVESVLMHYPARVARRGASGQESRERHTVCISSQAGCAVGCPFCATGELGFGRDLETAEILDQVRHAARRVAAGGSSRHLTNVVFMGMGEPLLNLDGVLEAIAALSDPERFGLGPRHVVVSTS